LISLISPASLSRQGDLALDCRNDPAAARAFYLRALHIQEELLAHPPEQPEMTLTDYRRSAAESHNRLGQITLRTDPHQLAEAEDHFQKARDLYEELVQVESYPWLHQQLAEICYRLGNIDGQLNQPAKALRAYDTCLAMRRKLAEDNPGNLRCKLDLFDLCGKVGDQYLFLGDAATARRYYQEAIAPNEQAAQSDNQPGIRKLLGLNYYRLASACLRLGEMVTADDYYKKCLDVRAQLVKELPNNPGLKIDLMLAQARCGLH
jgi:tetratricopeptide (TPR) repeat protein